MKMDLYMCTPLLVEEFSPGVVRCCGRCTADNDDSAAELGLHRRSSRSGER